ncbi:hypothetical protein SADUNF_Sadunf14G0044000 [Salix dunnii]|uniref:Pentatricopeptide repeat-containing protein n=1 Tax=Salix dunnii TaxID=1413687 RepID=A0A835JHZ5_9ROSI|nr:hypothetical protein SADUNF_Sadunf14G0044000 [Salix dunnii]
MLLTANLNQQPWNSTFPTLTLLKKCKSLSDINQIHARLLTTGFIKNTFLTTKIILSFSTSLQAPLIEFARYIFLTHHAFEFNEKEEEEKDPFLWNSIIKTYSHGRDPKEALWLVSLMLENGAFADKFTLSLVLKACSRAGLVKEGMQIHGLMKKLEFGSDLFLQNCLISLYVKCGMEDAQALFDTMPNRDIVSWANMIDGYAKNGRVDIARCFFDEMPERDIVACNAMMGGYVQNGYCMEALGIFYGMQIDESHVGLWNKLESESLLRAANAAFCGKRWHLAE